MFKMFVWFFASKVTTVLWAEKIMGEVGLTAL